MCVSQCVRACAWQCGSPCLASSHLRKVLCVNFFLLFAFCFFLLSAQSSSHQSAESLFHLMNLQFLHPITLNILCVASSEDVQSVLCNGPCLRQHTLFHLVWSGVLDCRITLCHACLTPYLQVCGPLTLNSVVLHRQILTFSSSWKPSLHCSCGRERRV